MLFIDSLKLAKEHSNAMLLQLSLSGSVPEMSTATSCQLDSDLNLNLNKKSLFPSKPCAVESRAMFNSNKLVKLLKSEFQKMDDERQIVKNVQQIGIEWKEVARRLEVYFFYFTMNWLRLKFFLSL